MHRFGFDDELRYIACLFIPCVAVAAVLLTQALFLVLHWGYPQKPVVVACVLLGALLPVILSQKVARVEIYLLGGIITAGLPLLVNMLGISLLGNIMTGVLFAVGAWQLWDHLEVWGEHENILPLSRILGVICALVLLNHFV